MIHPCPDQFEREILSAFSVLIVSLDQKYLVRWVGTDEYVRRTVKGIVVLYE